MPMILAVLIGVLLVVLCVLRLTPVHVDRWVRRHFVASAYGLPPREVLDDGRSGPPPPAHRTQEKQAVADAAWQGDWSALSAQSQISASPSRPATGSSIH
ncbi:hypothetical protein J2X68_000849 [Streptomyces sp. 3330]|uniref:hypothetical protein n=1 Tax=Streptomyces sp. 3330 TaxID=2817755 RepID=UPI002856021B|nr:hypothetical protein [Streptomyces sp. 3330]MDR6974171.1 hypothetical protein [Streptomyces sp. 3330]